MLMECTDRLSYLERNLLFQKRVEQKPTVLLSMGKKYTSETFSLRYSIILVGYLAFVASFSFLYVSGWQKNTLPGSFQHFYLIAPNKSFILNSTTRILESETPEFLHGKLQQLTFSIEALFILPFSMKLSIL